MYICFKSRSSFLNIEYFKRVLCLPTSVRWPWRAKLSDTLHNLVTHKWVREIYLSFFVVFICVLLLGDGDKQWTVLPFSQHHRGPKTGLPFWGRLVPTPVFVPVSSRSDNCTYVGSVISV